MVINELKARMGFGSARLEIRIPKNEYRQDEQLHGEVYLIGGKVRQKIRSIDLELVREWCTEHFGTGMVIGDGPGFRGGQLSKVGDVQYQYELNGERGRDMVEHIKMGGDVQLDAGKKQTFPFEIDLSKIKREEGVHEAWKLQARADIPSAQDAIDERKIKILTKKKA